MDGKSYTIILVPHTRAKFRKFQVSKAHLWIVACAALVLLVGSAWITWTYFSSPLDHRHLASLRSENDQLRDVNRTFEESIRSLQDQLLEYEERTRRLAIVAGLEELGASNESGLGGADLNIDSADSEDLRLLAARAADLGAHLGEVEDRVAEQMLWVSSIPTVSPARGLFTSGFGPRRDPVTGRRAFHQGLDISASVGKPVYATADAIVVQAGRIGRLGNAVSLAHGFGITTRYGHMARVTVKPGQKVRRGDVIGYVGNSGRSTGYHLHYEVHKDGEPVNPLGYILDR